MLMLDPHMYAAISTGKRATLQTTADVCTFGHPEFTHSVSRSIYIRCLRNHDEYTHLFCPNNMSMPGTRVSFANDYHDRYLEGFHQTSK